MGDSVIVKVVLKSNLLTTENIKKWLDRLTYFVPRRMMGRVLTNNKLQKYNGKKFHEGIDKEFKSNDAAKMSIRDDQNIVNLIRGTYCSDICWLTCEFTYELYQMNKSDILSFIDDIMQRHDGITAYMCTLEDAVFQDSEDTEYYHYMGISTEGINLKPSPIFTNKMIVDTEFNPGHSHIVNGIWFGSCWGMWFGKEYYKYIPKEVFLNFKQCYEIMELENEVIRIFLYKDVLEYDKKCNRDIQFAFRRQVGIDEVSHTLLNCPIVSDSNDAAIEIFTGEFEHNGVRLLKYYYDWSGNLVQKSSATIRKSYELDILGNMLWSEEVNIK